MPWSIPYPPTYPLNTTSSMRIDLFLKVSGLLRTRTIAGRAISAGAVTLNGLPVKASAQVSAGDVISTVLPDGRTITVRVSAVPLSKNVSRKDRKDLFELLGPEA